MKRSPIRGPTLALPKSCKHDEAGVPLPELDAQLLLVETPVDDLQALVGRYRDIIRSAVNAWVTE